MTLDATARERLEDIRELEPTTNGELADRWGLDSGKDVALYLRNQLSGYVYRDDGKRIRARNGSPPDVADGAANPAGGDDTAEGLTVDPAEAVDGDQAPADTEHTPEGTQSDTVTAESEAGGQDDPTPRTADATVQDASTSSLSDPGNDQVSADPPAVEGRDHGDTGSADTGESCPECGGPMERVGYGQRFIMEPGGWFRSDKGVVTDSTDVWCESCDLLLDPDTGNLYAGSEYSGTA